jgi:hypothetical protein
MGNCDVCCEKFNKINHKKVECPFCDLQSCRACSQRYLLSIADDPHCMGCKNMWNREFVDSFCTKYFRNTELRRHRENILFEREKTLMPGTQPEVERILSMRKLQVVIGQQRSKLIELHQTHKIYLPITIDRPIPQDILDLREQMEETYRELERLRRGGELVVGQEPKKFIRKCPTEECKGFMNEDWFCGMCDKYFCEKCNEKITEDHKCDPEAVKTMELINKDTKPCPKCGTMIHKLSGCPQMWCPECHTAFDWRTGHVETGRIHNPHYMEFKRGRISGREHADIPCGGIPTFRELREINASDDIMRFATILYHLDRDLIYRYGDLYDNDNQYLRVVYMLNELEETQFKKELQRRDKQRERFRDINNIFRMLIDTGGDLLRQYVIDPEKCDEIIDVAIKLIQYGNGVLKVIRKRYNCVTPHDINIF